MKKVIILLAFIAISLLLCNSCKQVAPEIVKRNYKTCTCYYYNYKFGEVDLNSKKIKFLNQYDMKENTQDSTTYISNDSALAKYNYKFDGKGNVIFYKENNYTRELKPFEKEHTNKYNYDDKGNILEEFSYESDGKLSDKTIYQYDNQQRLTESRVYGSDGSLSYTNTNTYDDKGNIINENLEFVSGGGYYGNNKFNSNGDLIEWFWFGPDGKFNAHYSYIYDNAKNKMEAIVYDSTGSIKSKEAYKYDNQGKMIEKICMDSGSSIIKRYTYKYNSDGNIIEEIMFDKLNEPEYKMVYVYTK